MTRNAPPAWKVGGVSTCKACVRPVDSGPKAPKGLEKTLISPFCAKRCEANLVGDLATALAHAGQWILTAEKRSAEETRPSMDGRAGKPRSICAPSWDDGFLDLASVGSIRVAGVESVCANAPLVRPENGRRSMVSAGCPRKHTQHETS